MGFLAGDLLGEALVLQVDESSEGTVLDDEVCYGPPDFVASCAKTRAASSSGLAGVAVRGVRGCGVVDTFQHLRSERQASVDLG